MGPSVVRDGDQLVFSAVGLPGQLPGNTRGAFPFDDGSSVEQVFAPLGNERTSVGQDEVRDLAAVVGPFGAVDNRSALQGHFAGIVSDRGVGHDPPDGQGKIDLNSIAALPGPAEGGTN